MLSDNLCERSISTATLLMAIAQPTALVLTTSRGVHPFASGLALPISAGIASPASSVRSGAAAVSGTVAGCGSSFSAGFSPGSGAGGGATAGGCVLSGVSSDRKYNVTTTLLRRSGKNSRSLNFKG